MNWTPPQFNAELAFQNSGGFYDSNYQFRGCSEFSSKHTSLSQQRKDDQDFIDKFILDKQQPQEKILKKHNIISNAKKLLLDIINEKKMIENDVLNLDINDNDFNSKREILVKKLNELNDKILKFNLDVKSPLECELKRRLKKRKGIKERREKLKALRKSQWEEIQEKHRVIDKILSERGKEVKAIKHEAALKHQADSVLHEVRRKKYEGKKMLNLLVALAKLRELRSKEEEKLGGYCSKQLTEMFNKVMSRFQNLWEKQLEVYKLEEKGLKIMLEESTVPHKKDSKFETNLLQWEKLLFGDITNSEPEKLLTLPETDIQALIQVRREWDQFLTTESTPVASRIPLGWVLPSDTEDKHWKAFIKTSKTSPCE